MAAKLVQKLALLKAADIPELVTMAKLELGLDAYLRVVHRGALAAMLAKVPESGVLNANALAKLLSRAYMGRFDVVDKVAAHMERVMALGAKATERWVNRPSLKPADYDYTLAGVTKAEDPSGEFAFSFDLEERRAIRAIRDSYLFWFDSHYEERLNEVVKSVIVASKFTDGFPLEEVGRDIRSSIETDLALDTGPFSDAYFEMLAGAATTTGRVAGSIMSLVQAGARDFTIVNPEDERTCERCSLVAGKTFPIEAATDQLAKLKAARTPDDVKAAQPWYSVSSFVAASESITTLTAAGIVLPPYHGACRCSVVIGPGGSTL